MIRISPQRINELNMLYGGDSTTNTATSETFSQLGAAKVLKDSDTNGDKVITSDEVTLSQAAFDKLDADKNGKVTKQELEATFSGKGDQVYSYFLQKRKAAKSSELLDVIMNGKASSNASSTSVNKAAQQYITNKDKNKDGYLSNAELNLSAATFLKLDVNKDKKIDVSEMRTALKGYSTTLLKYYGTSSTSSTSSSSNGIINSLLDVI